LALVCAVSIELGAGLAQAQTREHWALDRFAAQGVDGTTAATFQQLLHGQIASRTSGPLTDLHSTCQDTGCVQAGAGKVGARVGVYGTLGRLGIKVVVTATAVDAQSGRALRSETISVDRVEDLDDAADRMAEALVTGKRVEKTAELGTITHEEAKAPVRRDTRFGVTLGLEGILPAHGFADGVVGAGTGLGLWLESMDFVIEPRIGVRTDLGAGDRDWTHVPLEITLSYLLSRSDLAPLLGAGLGLAYVHEELPVMRRDGSSLVTTGTRVVEDSIFAFDIYARVGLLLLRTYDVSAVVALDYAFTFGDFEQRTNGQAVRLSLGVILGGT
jgi:hypothetical protein